MKLIEAVDPKSKGNFMFHLLLIKHIELFLIYLYICNFYGYLVNLSRMNVCILCFLYGKFLCFLYLVNFLWIPCFISSNP